MKIPDCLNSRQKILVGALAFACCLAGPFSWAQQTDPEDYQEPCKPGGVCKQNPDNQQDLSQNPPLPNNRNEQNVIVDPASMELRPESMPKSAGSSSNAGVTASKRPTKDLTEFQQFVYSSTGKIFPIYGYSLFEDVPTTFAPVDRIPVAANYVIGPGDELIIRAWGQVTISLRAVVDRNGNIYVPKVGSIAVAGIQSQQLNDYLKSAIGRVFQNFDLNVTLGELRSIQIFVVGQASRPGTYTVSSLSTLVNAIFASGGPSLRGSMRHIQLRRAGKTVKDFDLYDLLLKGDKSNDSPLLPGDVIYFPPVGPQMAITGSVNMPAIYELRDNTTLSGALEIAGGLSTTAAGLKVTIERIENKTSRRVDELNLDKEGLLLSVKDGDVVNVFPLSPRFDNSITLRGNVAQPGRYPWRPGMRVRDLIPSRDFLIKREYWTNKNRPQSGKIADSEGHAPEVNWDYALIERLDTEKLNTRLLPFNLGKAVDSKDPGDKENLELQAGDIITIYSQSDLKTPLAKQNKFVRLEGEFNAAGVYQVKQGGLRDIIDNAGGFTGDAYLLGAQFYRESTRVEQQKRLDSFVSQMEVEVERNLSAAARNVNSAEEAVALKDKADSQHRLIEKMRQVKADGRIVFTLQAGTNQTNAVPDLQMEDGDRFYVPARPITVNVIGAVYNESSQLFKGGWKAKDYLKAAGGVTRESDRKKIFVIRANGSVVGSAGSGWWDGGINSLVLMPGDTIVVPQNLNRVGFMRGLRDWTQIISQMALGAAAIQVLRN